MIEILGGVIFLVKVVAIVAAVLIVIWGMLNGVQVPRAWELQKRETPDSLLYQIWLYSCIGIGVCTVILLQSAQNSLMADLLKREGIETTAVVTSLNKFGILFDGPRVDLAFDAVDDGKGPLAVSVKIPKVRYNELKVGDSIPILYARTQPQVACPIVEYKVLESDSQRMMGIVILVALSCGVVVGIAYYQYQRRRW